MKCLLFLAFNPDFWTVYSQVSLGFPDFWLDGLFSLDFGPRLSSDTSLGFECSSVPLSGLDFSHGTFLVLSSVEDGPGDLSRILLGLELLLRFTVDQDDSFTIGLDVQGGFLRMSDLWVETDAPAPLRVRPPGQKTNFENFDFSRKYPKITQFR